MLSLFLSYGLPALCAGGAVAALIYVPYPLKRLALEALAIVAVCSTIYGHGRLAADAEWQAKIDQIKIANLKAIDEAEKHVREANNANETALKNELNELEIKRAAAAEEAQALRGKIAAAPVDVHAFDAPAHPLILEAIRGARR